MQTFHLVPQLAVCENRCSGNTCKWWFSADTAIVVNSGGGLVTWSCLILETPWAVDLQASLSITNSWSLLKLMSIESVMPSNHLILCRPFLLLPSVFPHIRVFSNESVLYVTKSIIKLTQGQWCLGLCRWELWQKLLAVFVFFVALKVKWNFKIFTDSLFSGWRVCTPW